MAKASIDLEIAIAFTAVNMAFNNDKVSYDVLKPFKKTKKLLSFGGNARIRKISTEEYVKPLESAPHSMKPILILAFNTGMRAGEIVNLRWNHIDLKSGFIRLTEADTKEGKPPSIPLNYHARNALSGLIQYIHHDYVFTYKSKPIKMISYIFGLCCKQAGLPYSRKEEGGITFHDIRRTVKTNMLKAGVDEVFRNVILGHSLVGMDRHYIQVEEDDLKEPIRKYTECLIMS